MKWIKVNTPDVENRQLQYDLIIDKDEIRCVLGKIWLSSNNEWLYELDNDWEWLEAKTEEEAKKEFQEIYKEHCLYKIDLYTAGIEFQEDLIDELDDLEKEEK